MLACNIAWAVILQGYRLWRDYVLLKVGQLPGTCTLD